MILDELKRIRRHLHQHPELSLEEFETTSFIKQELEKLNVPYYSPLETGMIAYLEGKSKKSIAFRADIDALPIQEENEIDYASSQSNKMHACGHDGHTAILLSFVKEVKKIYDNGKLQATVYFIFQPSEETNGGANLLLKAFNFPVKPSFIYGLHLMPEEIEGKVLSKIGPITASATEYRFFIKGRSAHVANKEEGKSSGEALLLIINHLSQLQHYHLPGLRENIVHIGGFKCGEAINTVPSNGYLEGSIRTFHEEDLEKIKQQMERIKEACCLLTGCFVELQFSEGYPATINDSSAYNLIKEGSSHTDLQWIEKAEPYLFGEDFSFYNQITPSCFVFLGCENVEKGYVSGLHTATFNFDEKILLKGVSLFLGTLQEFEETLCKQDGNWIQNYLK